MYEMVFELREFLFEHVYICFDIHSIKLVFDKSTLSIFQTNESLQCRFFENSIVWRWLIDKVNIKIRQCETGIRHCETKYSTGLNDKFDAVKLVFDDKVKIDIRHCGLTFFDYIFRSDELIVYLWLGQKKPQREAPLFQQAEQGSKRRRLGDIESPSV